MKRRTFLDGMVALGGLAVAVAPAHAEDDDPLRMRDLYDAGGVFSDYARAQQGQIVTVRGYMAPPLKADSTFFVLTRIPMAVCPFCESEAEWPANILGVYTARKYRVAPFNRPILTTGRLALGAYTDPETGFVSRVRIEDARYDWA